MEYQDSKNQIFGSPFEYLNLNCFRETEFFNMVKSLKHIKKKFRQIKITNTSSDKKKPLFKAIVENMEDFINGLECMRFHGCKSVPFEYLDWIKTHRKSAKKIINDQFPDFLNQELNLFIGTRVNDLIKRAAKYGFLNLIKYAESRKYFCYPEAVNVAAKYGKVDCYFYLDGEYDYICDGERLSPMNTFTIVKCAIEGGSVEIFEDCIYAEHMFEEIKNKVNLKGVINTPLYESDVYLAILYNKSAIIQCLIDREFDFSKYAYNEILASRGFETFQLIIDSGYKPNNTEPFLFIASVESSHLTDDERLKRMKYLFDKGIEPDTSQEINEYGIIENGSIKSLDYLISIGFSLKKSFLNSACCEKNRVFFNYGIEKGFVPTEKESIASISGFGRVDDVSFLNYIVTKGAPINKNVALYAAKYGVTKAIKLYVSHGYKIDQDIADAAISSPLISFNFDTIIYIIENCTDFVCTIEHLKKIQIALDKAYISSKDKTSIIFDLVKSKADEIVIQEFESIPKPIKDCSNGHGNW